METIEYLCVLSVVVYGLVALLEWAHAAVELVTWWMR